MGQIRLYEGQHSRRFGPAEFAEHPARARLGETFRVADGGLTHFQKHVAEAGEVVVAVFGQVDEGYPGGSPLPQVAGHLDAPKGDDALEVLFPPLFGLGLGPPVQPLLELLDHACRFHGWRYYSG